MKLPPLIPSKLNIAYHYNLRLCQAKLTREFEIYYNEFCYLLYLYQCGDYTIANKIMQPISGSKENTHRLKNVLVSKYIITPDYSITDKGLAIIEFYESELKRVSKLPFPPVKSK